MPQSCKFLYSKQLYTLIWFAIQINEKQQKAYIFIFILSTVIKYNPRFATSSNVCKKIQCALRKDTGCGPTTLLWVKMRLTGGALFTGGRGGTQSSGVPIRRPSCNHRKTIAIKFTTWSWMDKAQHGRGHMEQKLRQTWYTEREKKSGKNARSRISRFSRSMDV